jgi:microcystin-dependent protein
MLVSFNFAQKGFTMCNGQLLAINQNQALFSLLGTTFGGNGIQNFQLPNLQGRTPVGYGTNAQGVSIQWGEMAGEEQHTLIVSEVPTHNHGLLASPTTNNTRPISASLGGQGASAYTPLTNPSPMNGGTLGFVGGSQPHENRQPYLVMTWIIALTGIFPSRG